MLVVLVVVLVVLVVLVLVLVLVVVVLVLVGMVLVLVGMVLVLGRGGLVTGRVTLVSARASSPSATRPSLCRRTRPRSCSASSQSTRSRIEKAGPPHTLLLSAGAGPHLPRLACLEAAPA